MREDSKATIIILNWNGKHFLEQNLDSVLSQNYRNFEALIVDNGSSDGSDKYIRTRAKKEKKIRLLETGENLGYAGGNNRGIEQVIKEGKSKFVVILNNDVKVEPNWLENLISGFNDPDVGICTSKVLLYYPYLPVVIIPKSKLVLESLTLGKVNYHLLEFKEGFGKKGDLLLLSKKVKKGKVYYLAVPYETGKKAKLKVEFKGEGMKFFIKDKKYEVKKSSVQDVDLDGKYVFQDAGVIFQKKTMTFKDRFIFEFDRALGSEFVDAGCGAAMAVRCDLLKRFGGFREKYYMYFEDGELSFRLKRKGFKTKFVHDAVCYHYFWGSSAGTVSKKQTFYGTRNRLWFIRSYFGHFKFWYYFCRTLARACLWGLKVPFSARAKMYFSSYMKALVEALGSDIASPKQMI